MNRPSKRTTWALLCLAGLLGIAAAAAVQALATASPQTRTPPRAPTGPETGADLEFDPRRPC